MPTAKRGKEPPAVDRTKLTPEEKYFIRLFVQNGALESSYAYIEKRGKWKPGACAKMMTLKRVQKALHERMEPIRLEKVRQEMLADAVAKATQGQQTRIKQLEEDAARRQEELRGIMAVPANQKLNAETLEHELMRLVIGLNQDVHPGVKLDAIKASYVVLGTIKAGNTERISPLEPENRRNGPAVYRSLFDREYREKVALPAGEVPPEIPVAPVAPDPDEPFDLLPGVKAPAPVDLTALPALGESIEEQPPDSGPRKRLGRNSAGRQSITVEIG